VAVAGVRPAPAPSASPLAGRSFVGRERELARLRAALTRACVNGLQVLCVQGPPGIGKSALLERFVEDANLRAIRSTGSEEEAALPFGIIDQLLCQDPRQSLATRTAVRDGLGDPIAAGARLLAVLSAMHGKDPVALVIDDLHWADGPSLQAVAFALRRLRRDSVITLFGLRPDEGGCPPGLAQLLASDRGAVISLTGFDRPELRRLAETVGAGDLPTRVLDRLAEVTTGNPLHATALLAELDPHLLTGGSDGLLPAPRSYSRVVLGRLARCAPATQRLVVAASVLGTVSRLSEAARLARLVRPLPAVEEATRRELLTTRDTPLGTELSFCHPLIRAAVYHDLGAARRGILHESAAAVVDDEARTLHHRAAACPGDDDGLAATLADFACRELASGRPTAATAAATALRAAARAASSAPVREQHLLGALECLLAVGDAGGATALAETIADFTPTPRLHYLRGTLALLSGKVHEAEESLTAGWESIQADTDPAVASGIAAQMATLQLRRANAGESTRWAERALEDGASHLILGLNPRMVLSVGLATAGRYRDALAAISDLAEGPHDREPSQLDLLVTRGIVRLWSDDPRGAHRDLTEAVEGARRLGAFTPALFALFYLAEVEFRLGEWDEAVLHGQLAVSMVEDADQRGARALAHGNAALPLACRGAWQSAQAHVDVCLQAAAELPDETNITWAHSARAVVAAARGDHATVADAAGTIADALRGGGDQPGIKPWRVLGAEALAALGDPAGADRLLRPCEEQARAGRLPLARAAADRARALVELAAGRHDAADHHFRLALAHVDALPAPFDRAQTALAYGAFLRRRNQRRSAAGLLRSAHDAFVALGAAPYAVRSERELAGCGLTPAARTVEARLRLTPQEQAVAHLVAKGLRNRDVAAELVVSVKTVEYHLGNVYRKLGVTNRTELVVRLDGAQER
jgi:DNA-binding CsgD family transcriptional regulator